MEIHESAENYLETILMLSNKNPQVRSIDVANELAFSKPSVSVAMKKLRENDYVEFDDLGYIRLTEAGLAIAKDVYERHKIISDLLVSIGVSEETALEDACRVEHVISRETFEKLKEYYLGSVDMR